ncbi:hypothetical protein V8D89_012800 [Ganoderma adspersum]
MVRRVAKTHPDRRISRTRRCALPNGSDTPSLQRNLGTPSTTSPHHRRKNVSEPSGDANEPAHACRTRFSLSSPRGTYGLPATFAAAHATGCTANTQQFAPGVSAPAYHTVAPLIFLPSPAERKPPRTQEQQAHTSRERKSSRQAKQRPSLFPSPSVFRARSKRMKAVPSARGNVVEHAKMESRRGNRERGGEHRPWDAELGSGDGCGPQERAKGPSCGADGRRERRVGVAGASSGGVGVRPETSSTAYRGQYDDGPRGENAGERHEARPSWTSAFRDEAAGGSGQDRVDADLECSPGAPRSPTSNRLAGCSDAKRCSPGRQ